MERGVDSIIYKQRGRFFDVKKRPLHSKETPSSNEKGAFVKWMRSLKVGTDALVCPKSIVFCCMKRDFETDRRGRLSLQSLNLMHRRNALPKWRGSLNYFTAIHSTSTKAPFGKVLIATAERAG